MEFVFQQGTTKRLPHFPLALDCRLLAVEADLFRDGIYICHDSPYDFISDRVLQLGELFAQG